MASIGRLALIGLACTVASLAHAADVVFPAPLHITREVHDPISGTTVVLEEYAYGNRLVSVRGAKTSIADYERGELTEIDRDEATYSVTGFDVLARALAATGARNDVMALQSPDARVQLRSAGVRATKLGRDAEFFEAELQPLSTKRTVVVAVDSQASLSKEALEVLVGAAYPNPRRAEHDVILTAAARGPRGSAVATNAPAASQAYALPIEQSLTLELDGQRLEMRTSVLRVGAERPAAELLTIPAGARLVTSRIVAVQRELEQLDRPPARNGAPTTPP
jgi:hypothetical protein